MKTNLIVLSQSTYSSGPNGAPRSYQSSDALKTRLGAAKSIRAQLIGSRISVGTELRLIVYETPYEEIRPVDAVPGGTPFFTSAAITSARSVPVQIDGPFSGNVTLALEVKHSGGTTTVEFEGLLAVTLILED